MLCEDGGKADHRTVGVGHTIHHAADIFLSQSGFGESHGCGVHLVANGASLVDFVDFLLLFGGAHLDHGLDELYRCRFFLLVGMNAQQVENLQFVVVSVWRQEVDGAFQFEGLIADDLQLFHGS